MKWGHGCKLGVYAQHVYTSLPPKFTVLEYLRSKAAFGKKDQEILDVAGSFLFRGGAVEKPVSVLSGGERARLCMAGLLLSDLNILVLDEPGNHLDVDTVDALAEALQKYLGTVIFTSHDRFFMSRVATCIIEVRDGRVTNYSGDYETYLYQVNKEIEAGERELATARAKLPTAVAGATRTVARTVRRTEKEIRKEMKATERSIAQLDARRKELMAEFADTMDTKAAERMETEISSVGEQLAVAEDLWVQLNDELGDAE